MTPPIADEKKLEVIQLFEEGYSRTEIGQETGISHPVIRDILREAGYASETRKAWTPVDETTRAKIIDLRNRHYSYNEIARQVGRAKRTVMNVVKDDLNHVNGRGESASPEWFIATWQANDRIEDVGKQLGMSASAVITRASVYRRKGVPLKRYPTQKGYDWDELKQFAELFVSTAEDDHE